MTVQYDMKDPALFTWKTYLECQCSTKAHLICLEYDEELGLAVSVQLNQWRGFFKRLLEAFKYVFFKPYCGSWDTCMIRPDDIGKVRQWVQFTQDLGPGTEYGVVPKKK